jgi:hypothetical protein
MLRYKRDDIERLMCYLLYLSTDCPRDLTTAEPRFEPVPAHEEEAVRSALAHPNVWYLPCRYGGCSCHFRHAMSVELGFGEPEDWYQEDPENVQATMELHDFIAGLVAEGCAVDMVDFWGEPDDEAEATIDVSLSNVTREKLRFFEGHRFVFSP